MAHNIEPDRRSAVSSFYGGRRSSVDILNGNQPPPRGAAQSQHTRHDDTSSFYTPQGSRRSADILSHSAGYNQDSFFAAGRQAPVKGGPDEEEAAFLPPQQNEAFDVYADFNNEGPRYSQAFVKYDEGYQRLPPDTHSISPSKTEVDTNAGPVELVTVPALGAEWKRDELEAMTKHGRREKKWDGAGQTWKAWRRDQRGCCGKWGTRKQIAIFLFVLIACISIVLAFTIPRVPGFAFASTTPLLNVTQPNGTSLFSRAPANFSFLSALDLQVDTGSNYLPLKFNEIQAQISDLETGFEVGSGNITHLKVPANKLTEIKIPVNFTYVAANDSDATWNNWYNACRNAGNYIDGSRPGLSFRLLLNMKIAGLPSSHSASTQITNVNCPIELPLNSA